MEQAKEGMREYLTKMKEYLNTKKIEKRGKGRCYSKESNLHSIRSD